ncbi:MAG: hypothetical protein ACOZF0_08435 [Thermodesulfobacteriota bacterium]
MLLVSLAFAGCAAMTVSRSEPRYQFIDTELYYVSITPIRSRDYHYAFRLIVKNKTIEEMEIDWNKTFYLEGDAPSGGFMFDGIAYSERENPKERCKVAANDIFIKTLWPNVLVSRKKDWFHQPLESGRHGIEITLIVNRKQVCKERLLLNIIRETDEGLAESETEEVKTTTTKY